MCKSARVLAEGCTDLIFCFACCLHDSFPPATFPSHTFCEHECLQFLYLQGERTGSTSALYPF